MLFDIEERAGPNGFHRLYLTGDLDLATSPRLAGRLAAAAERREHLLLDIRGLEFMDSAGLHVLLDAAQRAADDGWMLTITRPEGSILRLLQLTQTLEALPLVDAAELGYAGTPRTPRVGL